MQFIEHPHTHASSISRRRVIQLGGIGLGGILLGACTPHRNTNPSSSPLNSSNASTLPETSDTISSLTTLPGFDEFANTVRVISSGDYWLVESNGIPAHNMMVGITSWQQQVPLEMDYTGSNSWQLPMHPKISDNPVSARTSLYRGAIALAVNGVPIFNALNNRGDDAFLFGELDQWGGHCGKADDYHYHVAPLHLSNIVGDTKPIAYALDGFPIYGATEPDGSAMTKLDEYNGHTGADGTYHYHGTTTYPYINGGLRGEIRGVVGDQVDPQPLTKPIRPPGEPLRGAQIIGFSSPKNNQYRLEYSLNGQHGEVGYTVTDSSVAFTFTSPTGQVTTETYSR